MKILIVNGWTRHGDDQHLQAKCVLQKNIFKDLVKNYLPKSHVNICDTFDENYNFNIDTYDAFIWTGGGGNIYENNSHNYSQLKLCEKIIEIDLTDKEKKDFKSSIDAVKELLDAAKKIDSTLT